MQPYATVSMLTATPSRVLDVDLERVEGPMAARLAGDDDVQAFRQASAVDDLRAVHDDRRRHHRDVVGRLVRLAVDVEDAVRRGFAVFQIAVDAGLSGAAGRDDRRGRMGARGEGGDGRRGDGRQKREGREGATEKGVLAHSAILSARVRALICGTHPRCAYRITSAPALTRQERVLVAIELMVSLPGGHTLGPVLTVM